MFRGESNRRESLGRWHSLIASSDSYVTRIMCGLVLSLGLAVAAVRLPLGDPPDSIGWYLSSTAEELSVEHLTAPTDQRTSRTIQTNFDGSAEAEGPHQAASNSVQTNGAGADGSASTSIKIQRILGRKVFDFAQQMPQIVGGMGAYYIHIEYPQKAIREGVEGRLVLSFIVDTVGVTHQIEVIESLHPACDSAAVQALRRTRFVPGVQDGEPVQVKMHLPVRFQLVPNASTLKQPQLEG